MQKHVNLVDLVNSFPTSIFLQNLVSIQPIKSLLKIEGGGFSAPVISDVDDFVMNKVHHNIGSARPRFAAAGW